MGKSRGGAAATTTSKTTSYAVPAANHADWVNITCSPALYSGEIDALRTKYASRSGVVWVRVTPVINGSALLLCLDGKNVYLNAICGAGGRWYYFDDAEGAIPSGATVAKGGAHYSKLQPGGVKKVGGINKQVANLANYAGNTSGDDTRRAIWLLVTFISEACRFNSVRDAMITYLTTQSFDLTSVESTVKNWSSATGTSTDVAIPYLK